MKQITFKVTRTTRNFGGLFEITTKSGVGKEFEYHDVGVLELYDIMETITEDLQGRGYSVDFKIGY